MGTKHLASQPIALPEVKGNWPDKIISQEKKKLGNSLHLKPLQAAGRKPKFDCKHEPHLVAPARLNTVGDLFFFPKIVVL